MPEDYPAALSTPPTGPITQTPSPPNHKQKKPARTVLILFLSAALVFSLAAFGYTLWQYLGLKKEGQITTRPPASAQEQKGEVVETSSSANLGDFFRTGNAAANITLGQLRARINEGSEIFPYDPSKALEYKARNPVTRSMNWKTEDEWTINIYYASSITIPVPVDESWKQQEKYNYLHPFSDKAISTISEYLQSKGFEPSEQNSSKPESRFQDFKLGFENKNTGVKCILSIENGEYPDVLANIDVFDIKSTCVDSYIFDENYKEQIIYLKAIGDKSLEIWGLMRKKGDFIYLGVRGHYIIGKLTGEEWIEIATGQDLQECQLMEANEVPEEIYGNCYYCDQGECQPKYPF